VVRGFRSERFQRHGRFPRPHNPFPAGVLRASYHPAQISHRSERAAYSSEILISPLPPDEIERAANAARRDKRKSSGHCPVHYHGCTGLESDNDLLVASLVIPSRFSPDSEAVAQLKFSSSPRFFKGCPKKCFGHQKLSTDFCDF